MKDQTRWQSRQLDRLAKKDGRVADIMSAVEVVRAVAEAIRELGEVPAGHLYASVCGGLLSLDEFNKIISILKGNGLVTESNHLLTYVYMDDYPRPMGAPKLP